jgi:hypothetical protein
VMMLGEKVSRMILESDSRVEGVVWDQGA